MNKWKYPYLVTGGLGFLGKVICDQLIARGYNPYSTTTAHDDLRDRKDAEFKISKLAPGGTVIHCAANCGGIGKNQKRPAELCRDNLLMGINVIEACRMWGVEKLVIVGTVCSYPKFCPAPFPEEYLWHGRPEETNEPYGAAKLMLLTLAQAYRQQYGLKTAYVIPTNLYGPGDNFDEQTSHVIPALIRRMTEARNSGADTVTLWGTGTPTREFLYVEDAARGIIDAAEQYDDPMPVNLGSNTEIRICDLAHKIAKLVGFTGRIEWDASKPDGQPRRWVCSARARASFGFEAKTELDDGLKRTCEWWAANQLTEACS